MNTVNKVIRGQTLTENEDITTPSMVEEVFIADTRESRARGIWKGSS